LSFSAPSYLSTTIYLPVTENPGRRYVCSAIRDHLDVQVTRTVRYSSRRFAATDDTGPAIWNSLLVSLHSCHLSSLFRRQLNTELLRICD